MHELSIAVEVVERAVRRARGAPIRAVTMEVGVLTCVLADALTFSFELVAAGTIAEGAELIVRQPAAQVRCNTCARLFELREPFGACLCGSAELQWLTGRELSIVELELEVVSGQAPPQCAEDSGQREAE